MPSQETETFPYREYVDAVWNAHDPSALVRYARPRVIVHSMTPGIEPGVGVDYLASLATAAIRAFPDLRFSVDDVIVQGDRLAARLFLEGTHRGEFMGLPPTGRRMRIVDFAMYRIEEGKFAEVWSLLDMAGMRAQLASGRA